MLDRLEFILGEAFAALRRNSLMSLAAVTTVAVSLFFLGGLAYVWSKLTAYAERLPAQLDARVYLKDEIRARDDISRAAEAIRRLPGVAVVQWIPRALAWEKKRVELGYREGEVPNLYPDALKIIWADLKLAPTTTDTILKMPEVDQVRQHTEAQRTVSDFLVMLRNVGIGIGGILLLTGGILIYNAIKLTILSRRREIRIMQLVGATRTTIATPFLLEGLAQGALGGALAALILWSAHVAVKNYTDVNLSFISIRDEFPAWFAVGVLAIVGALYGLICSSIAVREPTRFR